jgi:hypothetical protein
MQQVVQYGTKTRAPAQTPRQQTQMHTVQDACRKNSLGAQLAPYIVHGMMPLLEYTKDATCLDTPQASWPHHRLYTTTASLTPCIPSCRRACCSFWLPQLQHQPPPAHPPQQQIHPVLRLAGHSPLVVLLAAIAAACWCCRAQQPGAPDAPEGAWHQARSGGCEAPAHVLATSPAAEADAAGKFEP